MICTVLLQVRAYALSHMRKSLLFTFCILDTLAVAVFIVLVFEVKCTVHQTHGQRGCLPDQLLDTFYGSAFRAEEAQVVVNLNSIKGFTPVLWIPFFFNENVTFAVVIHKAWTSHRVPVVHSITGRKSSLLDTLIQHSALY